MEPRPRLLRAHIRRQAYCKLMVLRRPHLRFPGSIQASPCEGLETGTDIWFKRCRASTGNSATPMGRRKDALVSPHFCFTICLTPRDLARMARSVLLFLFIITMSRIVVYAANNAKWLPGKTTLETEREFRTLAGSASVIVPNASVFPGARS
jgi:hypothetical protein